MPADRRAPEQGVTRRAGAVSDVSERFTTSGEELGMRVLVAGGTGATGRLLAALRDLHNTVLTAVTSGKTLEEILQLNHMPKVLREHPSAVIPHVVTRDYFIQRVHRQRAGYWHCRGDGVELFNFAAIGGSYPLAPAPQLPDSVKAGGHRRRR
jgi:hypothetical protein